MEKFTTIVLTDYYNTSRTEPYPKTNRPRWDAGSVSAFETLPYGEVVARGVPFHQAAPDAEKHLMVLPAPPDGNAIVLPIGKAANYVCVAHCCSRISDCRGRRRGMSVAWLRVRMTQASSGS